MKLLKKNKVRSELMYGMYDNIDEIEVGKGGTLVPSIAEGSHTTIMLGNHIEVTIAMQHIFQMEMLGEEIEDKDLYDFNYIKDWGFTDANKHFDKIIKTKHMTFLKERIEDFKTDILQRIKFLCDCNDELGEEYDMELLADELDGYCGCEY